MTKDKVIELLKEYGADIESIESRFMYDYDLYIECIALLLQDENIAKLRNAMDLKDYGTAFEAAHALKGVAGNMGLVHLNNAVCNLVELLRARKYSDLQKPFEEVSAQLKRVTEMFS